MSRRSLSVIFRLFITASLLQRKRAILTVAAIAWGTVAILMLLSFGEGLKLQLMKSKKGMGENLAVVWPGETSKVFEGLPTGRRIRPRPEDIPYLRAKLPDLEGLVGELRSRGTTMTYGRKTVNARLTGTNAEYGELRNHFAQAGGRFFNPNDEAEYRRVVFLGDTLARDLFGSEEPVGKTLLIAGAPYLVIGVLQPKLQMGTYGGPDTGQAVIPITTFAAQFGPRPLENVVFKVTKPELMPDALRRFREAMGRKFRFDPTDNQALGVWDTVATGRYMATFTVGIQAFLGIIGGLTLIIGGVGVANIMYAVVKEKTREIGVQMALGARRSWITGPFVLQGMTYTLVGGAFGSLIAVCLVILLSLVPTGGNEALAFMGKPTLSWPIAAATAAVLGAIGILAGYFPARRAAGIDPASTLRYE